MAKRPRSRSLLVLPKRAMQPCAFTLVELLVVMAILAALVALLLPAVQAAREGGRRVHCQNNLRQIGVALLTYHDVHASFPHGGWGHEWVGVPERGVGPQQPGGWIYSLLPFLEEERLHAHGAGLTGAAADQAYSERLETPIPVFVCPTRRSSLAWPVADQYPHVRTPKPHGQVESVARADYAINGGGDHVFGFAGPLNFLQGDQESYWATAPSRANFSGISHLRTAASLRSLDDGASKTYLVGEKHLDAAQYRLGTSLGDNESLYAGYCTDLHRFVGALKRVEFGLSPYAGPLRDAHAAAPGELEAHLRFGSAHPAGLIMARCDGSARLVPFDIDPEVHFRAGHRRDLGQSLGNP